MSSAAFTLQGAASPVAVAAGDTVACSLVSTVGVRSVGWRIAGTSDSSVTTPTILFSTFPSRPVSAAQFGMPGTVGANGYAVIVECKVNGGLDDNGQPSSALIATGLVGVPNRAGRLPFCIGELSERDAVVGYARELNMRPALVSNAPQITPPAMTTSVDNYAPAGFAAASVVRLTSTGAVNITGLLADGASAYKFLLNANAIGTFNITLKHNSSSSDPANRFKLPGGTDLAVLAGWVIPIVYDPTGACWHRVNVGQTE